MVTQRKPFPGSFIGKRRRSSGKSSRRRRGRAAQSGHAATLSAQAAPPAGRRGGMRRERPPATQAGRVTKKEHRLGSRAQQPCHPHPHPRAELETITHLSHAGARGRLAPREALYRGGRARPGSACAEAGSGAMLGGPVRGGSWPYQCAFCFVQPVSCGESLLLGEAVGTAEPPTPREPQLLRAV